MIDFLILVGAFVVTMLMAYFLISRIPQMLHTPLMSMTNAISAVSILGALLIFAGAHDLVVLVLGALAVFLAVFNLAGGFLVTGRMLRFFRRS